MNKKIIAIIGRVSLLSACETASQKVVSGTSATSSSASASSSVDKKKSLFAQAKQTASDKLIAVGDRVLFDYDSAKLDTSAKILLDSQSRFLIPFLNKLIKQDQDSGKTTTCLLSKPRYYPTLLFILKF